MVNNKEIQTEINSNKSMPIIKEHQTNYSYLDSKRFEYNYGMNALSSKRSKDFKIITTFECETVSEQNLQDEILKILRKMSSNPPSSVNGDHDIQQEFEDNIDEYVNSFADDYIEQTGDNTQIFDKRMHSAIDSLVDFDSNSFFYKSELSHKIDIVRATDPYEIEFNVKKGSFKKKSVAIKSPQDLFIDRATSAPINLKIQNDNNYFNCPTNNKGSIKDSIEIRILGFPYSILNLQNNQQRTGSFLVPIPAAGITRGNTQNINLLNKNINSINENIKTGLKQKLIQNNK